jgi:hypothetical protein
LKSFQEIDALNFDFLKNNELENKNNDQKIYIDKFSYKAMYLLRQVLDLEICL